MITSFFNQKKGKFLLGNSSHWKVISCKDLTCEVAVQNFFFAEGNYVVLSSLYGFEAKECYELPETENTFKYSLTNHSDLSDGTYIVFDFEYNTNLYYRLSIAQNVSVPLIAKHVGIYVDSELGSNYEEFYSLYEKYKSKIDSIETNFIPIFFRTVTPTQECKSIYLKYFKFLKSINCSKIELIQCNSDESKDLFSSDTEFSSEFESIIKSFKNLKELDVCSAKDGQRICLKLEKYAREGRDILANLMKLMRNEASIYEVRMIIGERYEISEFPENEE